jgi:superfamily II DNA or RNA helicase/Arc/MetJ family transcription regulator
MSSMISPRVIWDSPRQTRTRCGPWWLRAPHLTAEALIPVPDPLLTGLTTGPAASPATIARAIAGSLLPAEDPAEPPAWLLAGQRRSFRRVTAALRRYSGALLADAVGSGKTYVALAVAATLNPRGPTACLVPAALASQWGVAAARTGVMVDIVSHERLSRGHTPLVTRGVVIIDESHRFRNPHTRRYGLIAPWLVGRPVLLVTATPVVNRLADLSCQLRLGVRDDALVTDGVSSLHQAIVAGQSLPALAQIVVEESEASGPRPSRASVTSVACAAECAATTAALERIGLLTLSQQPSTARLVRGVLQRAAGSSAAALLGALRRYRTLLLHARDAHETGVPLGRRDIRRFAGELEEQLVLWSLVGVEEGGLDLHLSDLDVLGRVIDETAAAAAGPDPKLQRLKAILADGRPSLIFVARRETVRHLRDHLDGPPIAWCTGERAGLGHSPVPREAVFSWFRTSAAGPIHPSPFPLHLVTTDVAAEGLDLQRAARVVHYDSPWTVMRLEQREGRAVRLGSEYPTVEVVRFMPPPSLEAAIHVEAGLSRKSSLPARAGLGPDASRQWRWRADLAAQVGTEGGTPGIGLVRGSDRGLLAGFTLHGVLGARTECLGAVVGWLNEDGEWSEDEDVVARTLAAAALSTERAAVDDRRRHDALRSVVTPIRAHLAIAAERRWTGVEVDTAARCLAARLRAAVHHAARCRDLRALKRLECALGFTSGGHTAGEAALVRCLSEATDRELFNAIAALPAATPRPDAIEVRISGLVLFAE